MSERYFCLFCNDIFTDACVCGKSRADMETKCYRVRVWDEAPRGSDVALPLWLAKAIWRRLDNDVVAIGEASRTSFERGYETGYACGSNAGSRAKKAIDDVVDAVRCYLDYEDGEAD